MHLLGHFCAQSGQPHVTGPCMGGYYCTAGASTPTPTNTLAGNICPKGHYCPEASPLPQACPRGFYSNSTGNTKVKDCLLCHAGTVGRACLGIMILAGVIQPHPPNIVHYRFVFVGATSLIALLACENTRVPHLRAEHWEKHLSKKRMVLQVFP